MKTERKQQWRIYFYTKESLILAQSLKPAATKMEILQEDVSWNNCELKYAV